MSPLASTIRHFAKGACMGTADVVPGVSGGTMALILGIYERLLNAIRSFDVELLKLLVHGRVDRAALHVDLGFVLPLLAGIATALAFFTRVVPLPKLIVTHPEPVYGLFFGLIVASIGVVLARLKPLSIPRLAWIALGVALGLAVVTLVPVQTPNASWFLFLCGAIAISAMILPGISGSFILLVLQKYAYVFDAIGRLDLSVIVPFALGCVSGLMLFSRFLSWLLARFHDTTLSVIVGVLVGSLWSIWPFQERAYVLVRGKQRLIGSTPTLPDRLDADAMLAAALALTGATAVAVLHVAARRQRATALS